MSPAHRDQDTTSYIPGWRSISHLSKHEERSKSSLSNFKSICKIILQFFCKYETRCHYFNKKHIWVDTILGKLFSVVITNIVIIGMARKYFNFMKTEGLVLFSHSTLIKEIGFLAVLKEIGEMESSWETSKQMTCDREWPLLHNMEQTFESRQMPWSILILKTAPFCKYKINTICLKRKHCQVP